VLGVVDEGSAGCPIQTIVLGVGAECGSAGWDARMVVESCRRRQLGGENLSNRKAGLAEGLRATLPPERYFAFVAHRFGDGWGEQDSYWVLVAKSVIEATKTA
jgi:hypothetical protein